MRVLKASECISFRHIFSKLDRIGARMHLKKRYSYDWGLHFEIEVSVPESSTAFLQIHRDLSESPQVVTSAINGELQRASFDILAPKITTTPIMACPTHLSFDLGFVADPAEIIRMYKTTSPASILGVLGPALYRCFTHAILNDYDLGGP